MSRLLFAGSLWCLSLFSPAALAASEYWLAIGSYQKLAYAETAQRAATSQLPESFAIVEAHTDAGHFYRVLAGPYLTVEIALHMLSEAHRAGFDSAWVLAETVGDLSSAYGDGRRDAYVSGSDQDLLEETSYTSYQSLELEADRIGSEPATTDADPTSFGAENRLRLGNPEPRPEEHQLVDEAPESYMLHRLKRSP